MRRLIWAVVSSRSRRGGKRITHSSRLSCGADDMVIVFAMQRALSSILHEIGSLKSLVRCLNTWSPRLIAEPFPHIGIHGRLCSYK